MQRAVGVCVLVVCVVWQSAASPTMILRSRRHRGASVTPESIQLSTSVIPKINASLKEAPVTNQPSVSLSVILKNLKNSTGSEKEASDKNQSSMNSLVTTEDPEYDTTGPEDTTDGGQSSESPSVTLKYNNTDSKKEHDENSTDSLRRDYNNSGSEEVPEENQFSDSSLQEQDYIEERLNEVVDDQKQSLLTPVKIHTKTLLQELLHIILLMEPAVNDAILNLKPIQPYNCTSRFDN